MIGFISCAVCYYATGPRYRKWFLLFPKTCTMPLLVLNSGDIIFSLSSLWNYSWRQHTYQYYFFSAIGTTAGHSVQSDRSDRYQTFISGSLSFDGFLSFFFFFYRKPYTFRRGYRDRSIERHGAISEIVIVIKIR